MDEERWMRGDGGGEIEEWRGDGWMGDAEDKEEELMVKEEEEVRGRGEEGLELKKRRGRGVGAGGQVWGDEQSI